MDIFSDFKTDEKAEKEGKWFHLGDARLKIASVNTGKYTQEILTNQGKEYHKMSVEQKTKLVAEALAKHVLVDWEGVTENGKEVPYSVEKATQYLSLRHFQDEVYKVADNFRSFLDEEVYEEAEEIKKP